MHMYGKISSALEHAVFGKNWVMLFAKVHNLLLTLVSSVDKLVKMSAFISRRSLVRIPPENAWKFLS